MIMTYGIIYHWHCAKTNMGYVGQTVNTLSGRWKGHVRSAFNPNSRAYYWEFPKAIREYGVDAFVGNVICECDTPKELSVMEDHWMHELNTLWPHGYNMRDGTNFVSEQTRELISKRTREALANIPIEIRQQQIERQRLASIGVKRSPEARENIRRGALFRGSYGPLSDEHKRKLSEAHRGHRHSLATRELMSQQQYFRKPASEETRAKISRNVSQALKGHQVSEETRQKIGKANRKLSDDQRSLIFQWLGEGQTLGETAMRLGVSVTTIRRVRDKYE